MLDLTPLYISQILKWADAFHKRWGRWPKDRDGRIPQSVQSTWLAIDMALRKGRRGLRPGSSLAKLLAQHRGVRNKKALPRLSIRHILQWADAFHRRHRQWPTRKSGSIPHTQDTWLTIDSSLHLGMRSFKGGLSLARVLEKHRDVRNRGHLPEFSEKQLLAWADAYHRRSGQWPKKTSGPVHEAPGETWDTVDTALRAGNRGLPGGSSLPDLLARRRGVRNKNRPPRLTEAQVLTWAKRHMKLTGKWPSKSSGPVEGVLAETWSGVHQALYLGLRGLPGGSSLVKLRAKYGL